MSNWQASSKTTELALQSPVSARSSVLDGKADGLTKTSSQLALCQASTLGIDDLALAKASSLTVNELLNVPWLKPFWPKASSFSHD